ncbi:MAG: hypothetical protein ACYDIA_06295 [Candidatus Humimicrobiaceae bacterium]
MHGKDPEINKLITKVTEELKKVQYTDQRLKEFIPTWDKLKSYLEKKKIATWDAKTGLNFLEEVYGITVFKKLSTSKASHAAFLITMNFKSPNIL